jgi:hypothetical protein
MNKGSVAFCAHFPVENYVRLIGKSGANLSNLGEKAVALTTEESARTLPKANRQESISTSPQEPTRRRRLMFEQIARKLS